MRNKRDYIFYSATQAICSQCLTRVEAKEIIQDDCVFLQKHCPEHGDEKVLISDDVPYWRMSRERYLTSSEQVYEYNTSHKYGCPYDCGICPEHEQHGCVSILEITDNCNLACPTCYASSKAGLAHRDLATIRRMHDRIVKNEKEPDIIQISGGEPTTHPEFFDVLDMVYNGPTRHVMVNTNGVKISRDIEFVKRLAEYRSGLEVYLQFDSLNDDVHKDLRGLGLAKVHEKALEHLQEFNISTNLVVVVKKDANDHELGKIIDYALTWKNVRGVTFQPIQVAGRNVGYNPETDRLTLSQVRRNILEQSPWFEEEDLIPVPCHPDCLAMAYGVRDRKNPAKIRAISGLVDRDVLLSANNSITFEKDESIRAHIVDAFSARHSPLSSGHSLHKLLCCLPVIKNATDFSYEDVFRVIIMQFLDIYSMDMRSVRKSCVHIAHPDGRRVMPFDTYNVFYRGNLEKEVLNPLRKRMSPDGPVS